MTRCDRLFLTATTLMGLAVGALIAVPARADSTAAKPPQEIVRNLMQKDLIGVAGKEAVMLTVQYVPAGASMPHRHNAQVFVYVLEGSVHMQVKGSPMQTLHAGETFYEGPDDIHTVSENASRTRTATILVFEVKDKTPEPSGTQK